MLLPSYNNNLIGSFALFLDHEIQAIGSGFQNYSGALYPTTDPNYSGFNIWASPFRQWCSDGSIAPANIPSGVYNGSTFIPKGTGINDLHIDYQMGRVMSRALPKNTSLSTSYAIKDFNIYITNVEEETILFELAPELPNQNLLGIQPNAPLPYNSQPINCIFLKDNSSENDPWALGGMDVTKSEIRAVVLSNNSWDMDAVLSLSRDLARKYFLLLTGNYPYDIYGDTGPNGYNYNNLYSGNYQQNLIYIENVKVSRMSERVNRLIGNNVIAGLMTFNLERYWQPRVYK